LECEREGERDEEEARKRPERCEDGECGWNEIGAAKERTSEVREEKGEWIEEED
jgi:hypothetical protein